MLRNEHWTETKARADRYMMAVKQALGMHLFRIGTMHEDACEATDLRFVSCGDVRVSVRVREHDNVLLSEFLGPNGKPSTRLRDVTFRSARRFNETEVYKIFVQGLASHYFYGFASESGDDLRSYIILDLEQMRRLGYFADGSDGRGSVVCTKPNRDGSSSFVAIDTLFLPDSVIVGCSDNHPRRR